MIDNEHPDHQFLAAANAALLMSNVVSPEDELNAQALYMQQLSLDTSHQNDLGLSFSMGQMAPWPILTVASPVNGLTSGTQSNPWYQDMISTYDDESIYTPVAMVSTPITSCPSTLASLSSHSSSPSLSHIRNSSYSTTSSPFPSDLVDYEYLNCEIVPLSAQPGYIFQSDIYSAAPLTPPIGHYQAMDVSPTSPELPWAPCASTGALPSQSYPPTPCASDLGIFTPSPRSTSPLSTNNTTIRPEVDTELTTIEYRRALACQNIARTRVRASKRPGKKRPQCPVCGLSFSRAHNLKCHMPIHTGQDKDYPCNLCSQSFARNTDRQRHIDGSHLGIKPFRCDICDKCFPRKDTLRRHVEGNCYDRSTVTTKTRKPRKKSTAAKRKQIEVKQELAASSSSKPRRINNPNYVAAMQAKQEATQSPEQQHHSAVDATLDLVAFVIKQE